MPCCGFALFVIGQVVAGFLVIRRALGFAGAEARPAPLNPATAWQLHPAQAGAASAPAPRTRGLPLGRWLLLVGVLEVGLCVAGAVWLHGGEHASDAHQAASLEDPAGSHGVAHWSDVGSLHP